jgi:hypothetical protein
LTTSARVQSISPPRSRQGWLPRALFLVGLGSFGCAAPGQVEPEDRTADLRQPAITDLAVGCDLKAGTWRIEVSTDAWAGGAAIAWTVDGAYKEVLTAFRSVKAAPDGTSDLLRADLTIVDDFRPAGTGSATVFTCNDTPSALVWVVDLAQKPADCRQFGQVINPLLALEETPKCPDVWTFPTDTDAAP